GAGKSTMPLCSSALRARRWRFTMFTPSTVTRPVLRYTRITFPSLPLSSPRMTRTVSPAVTCTFTRAALSAWRLRFTAVERSATRCLSTLISDHLGRQGHDLHVPLVAQLARDRTEDAGRPGLSLIVDDHHGVLVEPDVAPVLPPRLLGRAHHDGARDVGLLHGAVRQRVLHRHDHDVAQAGVAPAGAAEDADHLRRLGAGIVRDLHHRLLLNHRPSPLPRPIDDLDHAPTLVLRQGARLRDPHRVAGLGGVLLVVRFDPLGAGYHLAVHRMRHTTFDRHHHRLLHLVAHHEASARLARGPGLGAVRIGHLSHWSVAPLTRAPRRHSPASSIAARAVPS